MDRFFEALFLGLSSGAIYALVALALVVVFRGTGTLNFAQGEMATLSANSLHRVVPAATHVSLIENRDDATAVSQAVHDVVVSVRTSAPLAGP